MNDEDLTDLFAGMALQGLIAARYKDSPQSLARAAYLYADAMVEAKYYEEPEAEEGITAIKPKSKRSVNVSTAKNPT